MSQPEQQATIPPTGANGEAVSPPGRRRSEARRLTATSDYSNISDQLKKQLENKKDNWVLDGPTVDINEHYTLGRQLGQPGQFGRALLVQDKRDGCTRAVKIVSKLKFSRAADRRIHFRELRQEIDILKRMNHENIIRLYDVYENANELFIVMEVCTGGELFDRIKAQPTGAYSEKEASKILRQICTGLKYLHENKIAHCDLKPDNFLFEKEGPDTRLKIIDFGMSKFVKRRQYFHSLRGTPYYIAPEVLKGQYNEAADMWSFGIVMFVMLFGYPPFHADSDQEIFRQILEGFTPVVRKGYRAHFPAAIPCSDSAKDLISKLLTFDTARRLTAEEALNHPWLTGESASSTPMVMDVLINLKNFNAHNKFKQGILNIMVNTLSDTDLQRLKKMFLEIDENQDGHITVQELTKAVEKSGVDKNDLLGDSTGKLTASDLQRIIQAADIDGDGRISYRELVLTTVQRKLSAKEERLWAAFCRVDKNGDGFLSPDEVSSVLGSESTPEEIKEMISESDKNGDGRIDFDEFLNMWVDRQEKQKDSFTGGIEQLAVQDEDDLPPGARRQPSKPLQ